MPPRRPIVSVSVASIVAIGLLGCTGQLEAPATRHNTADAGEPGAADEAGMADGAILPDSQSAGGQTTPDSAPAVDTVPTLDGNPPVNPSCTDGMLNGKETDVDCGGSCGGCTAGKACVAATDCLSQYCHTDKTCAPSPVTPDGCYKWPSKIAPSTTLHGAVAAHKCVEVQAGTYTMDKPVALKPGHTLRGVDQAKSILRASQSAWSFNCCDSIVRDTMPANPATSPFTVRKLTLDGAGVATYNICCRGYMVEESVLKRSRCSAIGIAGVGVIARKNQMIDSAQPTQVPGKGTLSCATGGFGGVAEGAAIYSEGKATDYASLIEGNVIKGTYGPALDINGAWGGTFSKNTVSGNSAWAAVSLYGASNWTIEGNTISHPANEPPQPYHPYCATGPSGGHAAGIFLCQDTDTSNLVTNGNKILNNKTSSHYGILSVGADELKPYWAPRNNTFSGNDVLGSLVGCADDFKPGQWMSDMNVWTGNNCAGKANTPPTYF